MGFPNPRKVTVLALIPLSLGTFLGLFTSCYWTMGLTGWVKPKKRTQDASSLDSLSEMEMWMRMYMQMHMGLDGDHG